ncbi:glycoside hydrolase family 16 protein [Pseudalkalibacillus caeni]|nr:glycoside hydrolase family 16 protein [Pseudalkalibacillus caeni]
MKFVRYIILFLLVGIFIYKSNLVQVGDERRVLGKDMTETVHFDVLNSEIESVNASKADIRKGFSTNGTNFDLTVTNDVVDNEKWKLVWHDEFNAKELDQTKWNKVFWESEKNEELQYYIPENVFVKDGFLQLKSDDKNYKHKPYTSGAVTTEDKFTFKYGKLVVRARLPVGKGMFPAIWTLPATSNGLPEIDVMENLGHKPEEYWAVMHWYDENGKKKRAYNTYKGPDFSKGLHTFSIEWSPKKVKWLVDEQVTFETEEFSPDVPMFLYLNTAVGGEWPGNPDQKTEFPQLYKIDYVRFYKQIK